MAESAEEFRNRLINQYNEIARLAGALAHEIKNPLSGIRGAAQLLESSVPDEDRALTRLICDETDRIVSLVDRMEIFSDERPVDRFPVNIHSVLDHVKAAITTSEAVATPCGKDCDEPYRCPYWDYCHNIDI